jgi:TonB family protein
MDIQENSKIQSFTSEQGLPDMVLDYKDKLIHKRFDYALVFAVTLHVLLFIFILVFSNSQQNDRDYDDLNQISFIDQTYRPEVARILPKGLLTSGSQTVTEKSIEPQNQNLAQGKVIQEVSPIDLSSTLDRSQAEIDLNRYRLETGDRELDVIRIGNKANGTQKSIDEILLEKPIALSKGTRVGVQGLAGLPGIRKPEEPQIKLEHRPIEKPKPVIKPEASKSDLPSEPVLALTKGTNISIAGLISQRAILNKVMPKYPQWALKKGISGAVVLKLWVMPDGSVKPNITVEQSSGFPELDQTVVIALTRWQFAPLAKDVVQETQWGIITFKFTLI